MKLLRKIPLIIALLFIVACNSNDAKVEDKGTKETEFVDVTKLNLDNLIKEIKKREKAFKQEKTINNKNAILLMQAYVAYSERFANRENADEYLFKSGEIAMGLNMTIEALKYLDRLYNEFPRYEKRAYGLFLKAFVLENQAQNLEEAKLTYEKFIQEFPGHEMVDDAKASISNLGKSPEEIIRGFEIQDSLRKLKEAA